MEGEVKRIVVGVQVGSIERPAIGDSVAPAFGYDDVIEGLMVRARGDALGQRGRHGV